MDSTQIINPSQVNVPPTGNPILDNPTLKAALIQHLAQATPQAQQGPPPMPPPGAAKPAPPIMGSQAPQMAALRHPAAQEQPPMGEHLGLPETPMPAMGKSPVPQIIAPRGTVEGDEEKRTELLKNGSGISRIAHNIEGTQFGHNHPVLGKIAGMGLQGLATLGDIGLSLTGPGRIVEGMIPGTAGYHAAQLRNVSGELTQDEANREKEAQTGAHQAQAAASQAEIPLRGAQTAHEQAETVALQNPQLKPKEESWKVIPEYTGPNGEPIEVEQNSGEIKIGGKDVSDIKPSKAIKEGTPQQETYDSLIKQGLSPIQAYEKIREKPAGTTINEGTWSLQEDKDGNSILLNSKTGEAKAAPAGIAKSGTHAKVEAATKKEMEPIEGAVGYASDYLKNGTFTGPGDEALQEKFFELAKPSTGFRMTQQQMKMLQDSRSWMGGLEGHLRHATTGTWFSDDQRKQIVDTMNQLAEEKRKAVGGTGGQSNAPAQGAPTATHRWNPATGEIEEIKK